MGRKVFSEGVTPSLKEVLHTREQRVLFQEKLLNLYPGETVVSFKLNIPGPVKDNEAIRKMFSILQEDLQSTFEEVGLQSSFEKVLFLSTGPEGFCVLKSSGMVVKKVLMILEEETPLGRLYDLDVHERKVGLVHTISRKEVGHKERKCLLCSAPAKVCGRARVHDVESLHAVMETMLEEEPRF